MKAVEYYRRHINGQLTFGYQLELIVTKKWCVNPH
jgi:hypothetical protein